MRILLCAALLLISTPSWGAIAEVSSMRVSCEWTNAASSTACVFPNNITSGNLLIAAGVNWNVSDQTMAVTGCSTTWTVIQGQTLSADSGVYRSFVAYGIAGTSGACTPTIDPSGSGNYGSASLDSFSGVHGTPLDADGGSSTGTSSTPSDSITTGTANALIIGVLQKDGTASTLTPGGSYTQFGEIESVSNAAHNAEFLIATTATSYSVNWTTGASRPFVAQTVSFKEASGGGSTPVCQLALIGVGC